MKEETFGRPLWSQETVAAHRFIRNGREPIFLRTYLNDMIAVEEIEHATSINSDSGTQATQKCSIEFTYASDQMINLTYRGFDWKRRELQHPLWLHGVAAPDRLAESG